MIPKVYVQEWKGRAPWNAEAQVEQDLIISRALKEIYGHPQLAETLAFRGGTALFKFHLGPMRYSEDIDLVMVNSPGPVGSTMDMLQDRLNHWLGSPSRKRKEDRVTLIYRMSAEDGIPLKLKVEINTVENFSVLGYSKHRFDVNSSWFSGTANVLTYHLDELLGTKMRALYQRKKGRDLFDLWAALTTRDVHPERVVGCFLQYMKHGGQKVSRSEFETNLQDKLRDVNFVSDVKPLIAEGNGFSFNIAEAAELVTDRLSCLIPGKSGNRSPNDTEIPYIPGNVPGF